jgi:putative methyltransferase (TIGR04325 family)
LDAIKLGLKQQCSPQEKDKMNIRDLLPPIMYKAKAYFVHKLQKAPRITFPTYSEAIAVCGPNIFDQKQYVNLIIQKTKSFRDDVLSQSPLMLDVSKGLTIIGVMLALSRNPDKEIKVIDFGGACGEHYFLVKSFLGYFYQRNYKLRWHVVETRATVDKSKELENDELKFFDNLDLAKENFTNKIDLVHSSGTIQCVPEPFKVLGELLDCNSQFLILSRLGLSAGERDVIALREASFDKAGPRSSLNNLPNTRYKVPLTFVRKHDFDKRLNSKYTVRVKFDDLSGIFPVEGESIIGISYLAERNMG